MKKILAFFRRLFKTNSAEKELLAYNKEVREAIQRKNEALNWLYDITRYGTINK